jgi:hypothetical protein
VILSVTHHRQNHLDSTKFNFRVNSNMVHDSVLLPSNEIHQILMQRLQIQIFIELCKI